VAEESIDAGDEITDILVRKRIVEGQHRPGMHDRRKGDRGCSAHPPRRTVFAHQLGKARLDRVVQPLQRIVIGIRNLRRILAVIEGVVMGDLPRQPLQFCSGLFHRHDIDIGIFSGHRRSLRTKVSRKLLEIIAPKGSGEWRCRSD